MQMHMSESIIPDTKQTLQRMSGHVDDIIISLYHILEENQKKTNI